MYNKIFYSSLLYYIYLKKIHARVYIIIYYFFHIHKHKYLADKSVKGPPFLKQNLKIHKTIFPNPSHLQWLMLLKLLSTVKFTKLVKSPKTLTAWLHFFRTCFLNLNKPNSQFNTKIAKVIMLCWLMMRIIRLCLILKVIEILLRFTLVSLPTILLIQLSLLTHLKMMSWQDCKLNKKEFLWNKLNFLKKKREKRKKKLKHNKGLS